jgi:hypothetical protein
MAEQNENLAAENRQLHEQLAALQTQLHSLTQGFRQGSQGQRDEQQQREATPSVWGRGSGTTGRAAMPAFESLSPAGEPTRKHAEYSDKAKPRAPDPVVFKGSMEEFPRWVHSLHEKFREDAECFRSEASRMQYLMRFVEGTPAKELETRYLSSRRPFSGVAEMIQMLDGSYADPNEGPVARATLRTMMFRPGKNASISTFISEFNSLAEKAGVPDFLMKETLFEHIPASLDPRLYGDSRKQHISYEQFCDLVKEAAYTNTIVWQQAQDQNRQRAAGASGQTNQGHGSAQNQSGRSNDNRNGASQSSANGKKPPLGHNLTDEQRGAHRRAGTCYLCGVQGHIARFCPAKNSSSQSRAQVNAVNLPAQEQAPSTKVASTVSNEQDSEEDSDSGNEEGR